MNEAGGNKRIQLELANPVRIQFPGLVAEHNDLQAILRLELADQLDHFGTRFRLRKHEAPELRPGERSLQIKDHSAQIFLQRELVLFVDIEVQAMPLFEFAPVQ